MDKPVVFVCKDPGGTNGVLPVYDTWVHGNKRAVLIANGKAVELLQLQQRAFRWYPSPEAVVADTREPAVLVTSMCSQGGIGRDLVPILRGKCPMVALQDFWGAALRASWEDAAFRPDYLVVNDKVGLDIARRAWPDVPSNRIAVLRYPALDRFAGVDADAVGARVRGELGITADESVVLFAGQLAHSGDVLAMVVDALNAFGQSVCLIPRAHPRLTNDAPEEVPRWKGAIARFRRGRCLVDTARWTTQEIIAAATVVVSMYSTVLVEAAAIRRPGIAVFTPPVMERFRESSSGIMPEFPLVELGCCVKVVNQETLEAALRAALVGSLAQQLRPVQERAFVLDGKNAERIAAFVRSLVTA